MLTTRKQQLITYVCNMVAVFKKILNFVDVKKIC